MENTFQNNNNKNRNHAFPRLGCVRITGITVFRSSSVIFISNFKNFDYFFLVILSRFAVITSVCPCPVNIQIKFLFGWFFYFYHKSNDHHCPWQQSSNKTLLGVCVGHCLVVRPTKID